MSARIYQSRRTDVHWHLAAEEVILGELGAGDCALYLWRAADAVVIGKHQNPWRECRYRELAADGGRLARRISGGGAVFHDLGNLNFSFFLPKARYDKDALTGIVLAAVQGLGIAARVDDRHVLLVEGRKFSGNAFCFRRNKVLHHGTVLVDADLDKLQRYLRPTEDIPETRGILSVPATVGNLAEQRPGLTVDEVAAAIAASFRTALAPDVETAPEDALDADAMAELQATHASWDWLFGQTPRFEVLWESGADDQAPGLRLTVKNGRIEGVEVAAASGLPAAAVEKALTDCTFQSLEMSRALRQAAPASGEQTALEQLADRIESKEL